MLLAAQGIGAAVPRPNIGASMEGAKPQVFNRMIGNVLGFVTVYKLFLRMKLKRGVVEEQIQWILSYMQGESACYKTKVWTDFG